MGRRFLPRKYGRKNIVNFTDFLKAMFFFRSNFALRFFKLGSKNGYFRFIKAGGFFVIYIAVFLHV